VHTLKSFPGRAVAALLSFLLLAGCAGGSKTESAALPASSFAPDAEFDDEHGAIKGQVTTTDIEPIVGAQLLVRPGDVTTTTALDGGYVFSNLAPADYTVFVNRLGFKQGQRTVHVAAGEVTEVNFELAEIPVAVPRVEKLSYTGYMQCRASTSLSSGACGFLPLVGDAGCLAGPDNCLLPKIWTSDKNELLFKFSGPDYSQIVFEARWTPSTAATNPKMTEIFSYKNRTSTHWFANSTPSLSPLKFTHTAGKRGPGGQFPGGQPDLPNQNLTLRTWLTLPFGTASASDAHPVNLAYELRFETFVTIFYSQMAPADYTAWTD
jgi:carboxypeptidase family protein